MNIKSLEQQLKEHHWIHNFEDLKTTKKLLEQAADLLDDKDQVFSITYAKKVNLDGQPSSSWWLMVLTSKEIILAESDINAPEETWRSSPDRLAINEVKTIRSEKSKLDPQLIRLVVVANEQGFAFESIDVDSALHFVQKTQALLGEIFEEETLFLKTKELKGFDTIEPVKTKKEKKEHKIFNHFFNFSSLFKSTPALETLFLGFQAVWILCDIIWIGLVDNNNLSRASSTSLGIVMLTFNLLSWGTLIPLVINAWEPKTLGARARKLILVGLFMFLLLIVSTIIIGRLPSSLTFSIVGLFTSFGIFGFVALDFIRGIIEVKNN